MKVKKTQITVETYEIFAIKQRSGRQRQIRCNICNAAVQGLKPEEAAKVIGISVRAIDRLIESEALHFTESSDGSLLICYNSLTQK